MTNELTIPATWKRANQSQSAGRCTPECKGERLPGPTWGRTAALQFPGHLFSVGPNDTRTTIRTRAAASFDNTLITSCAIRQRESQRTVLKRRVVGYLLWAQGKRRSQSQTTPIRCRQCSLLQPASFSPFRARSLAGALRTCQSRQ